MGLPSFNFLGLHYPGATATNPFQHSAPEKRNCAIWLNGLNDPEKHQLSQSLKTVLFNDYGIGAVTIDGDELQEELCQELGFCYTYPRKNMQRVAEVAKLIMDSGVFTIVSCRSALAEFRSTAQQLLAPNHFIEVLIKPPVSLCEPENIGHLYRQSNCIECMKIIDSKQTCPENEPELEVRKSHLGVEQSTSMIIEYLEENLLI